MGKKTQGVIFLLLAVGCFGNLISKLNEPTSAPALDVFSVGLPALFFVIGIVLLVLGFRENASKPYE